jgi:hypothetical protein
LLELVAREALLSFGLLSILNGNTGAIALTSSKRATWSGDNVTFAASRLFSS